MQKNQTFYLILILLSFIFFSILPISKSIPVKSVKMDQNSQQSTTPSSGVYIVYTEKPSDGVEPESFHLSTLSSVLGGEEAAKDSLIYVYKNAATGFSAKLTPEQVSELQKQPGVIQVVPSQTLQLHAGGLGTNMRV
ncbi:hypothetical protein RND81_03G230700 [Saponaria officinalis]|uniref:Inhibitor I9 domain-containing protein n=1 Tax=Saponaria officinalis TaxID=3572 RepID=A0AAW1M9L6_SAPOF